MKRTSFTTTKRLSADQISMVESAATATSETANHSHRPGSILNNESATKRTSGTPILFFGYGPIVHEVVRKRRNIRTTNCQAAFLDGYRLSFDFGGVANIVRKRGYRVHGVLMTLPSLRDWKKLQSFDIRRRVTQRLVFHYPKNGFQYDEDAYEDDEEKEELCSQLAYFIEFPEDVYDTLTYDEDPVAERLPQESYLKLIAEGMQQHRICYEYIEDSILNVPYIPDRSWHEYSKFPRATQVPKISYTTYQRLCQKAKTKGDLYFVLGNSVLRLGHHDPNNPLAIWLEEHGHGKGDLTFFVQLILINPEMPFCQKRTDVTPRHIEWAENQLVETIQQHGLSATKVYQFINDDESEDGGSSFFNTSSTMGGPTGGAGAVSSSSLSPRKYDSRFRSDSGESTAGGSADSSGTNGRKKMNKVSIFFKRMVTRNR